MSEVDIDSYEVEENYEIAKNARQLIFHYMNIFRSPPMVILLNPHDWLTLGVNLMLRKEAYKSDSPISIDGVPVLPKMNGPMEVVPRHEDVKYIAWMKQKDDKKLWPLLMGA